MEHDSDVVAEGRLIGETTYQHRSAKYSEIEISFQYAKDVLLTCKLDYYDAKNKIAHEVKKSDSKEVAHEWQVKFYLWVLLLNGVDGVTGILEYPKLKETKDILLTEVDAEELKNIIKSADSILLDTLIPARIQMKYCKNCSYYELCYVGE